MNQLLFCQLQHNQCSSFKKQKWELEYWKNLESTPVEYLVAETIARFSNIPAIFV